MKLDEIVSWYQKKIGTYDKEPWEKTVEEKILDGFSGVTLKTAKLKTELIDVDLVRGSTFPKAKPKQSLFTVIRLAILRYLFLPIYAQWWVRQTSPKAFLLMLTVYITQMINWAIYSFNINRSSFMSSAPIQCSHAQECFNANNLNANKSWKNPVSSRLATTKVYKNDDIEHFVFLSDLLIPMTLGLLLSFIHSQIVATNIAQSGSKSTKRRRFSNTNNQNARQKEGRLRRRKKLVKLRNTDCSESNLPTQRRPLSSNKNYSNNQEDLEKLKCEMKQGEEDAIYVREWCTKATTKAPSCSIQSQKVNLKSNYTNVHVIDKNDEKIAPECSLRRRSVNWHSPIHNYAGLGIDINLCGNNIRQTQEKQQQTSPQNEHEKNTVFTTTSSSSSVGGGATSSNTASPQKTVRIDDCVQEFYEDLMQRTLAVDHLHKDQLLPVNRIRNMFVLGEDDGFESLNGKSSSGEDVKYSYLNIKNQKPLRLNNNNNDGHKQQRRREDLNNEYMPSYHRLLNSSNLSSDDTEEEGDEDEIISSPVSPLNTAANYNECTTSATEWLGITTNTDECSYSSDLKNSDNYKGHKSDDNCCDVDFAPATLLNPVGVSDRISCTVWDQREIKKAQMSVLEISSCIIENVESMPETNDYVYMGIFFSLILSLIPCSCRLIEAIFGNDQNEDISYFDIPIILWKKAAFSFGTIWKFAFGRKHWERSVLILSFMQRLSFTLTFFMILAVAERTFKQKFLYAKLFSHLTSSRRARKSNLPHFRLNKVRNIKTWLSVRSYLKKRGPQRSVDVIVSAAFMITLFLLGFLSVEWLKDSVQLHSHLNMEALLWSATIGVYVLRYMTLGNKIHHKYRSVSVLITEQINLYLQIEKKPKKKDELMVSNSVLKLAADLLKELETPFKISGLSANPYLFTTIKVFILSALSGVLSEMLGFKLKLHKIKIK